MTAMISGLVSTILPVHNRPDLLRRAVRSVLRQTYRPLEILVVDDGSTDTTPRVVDELAAAHPEVIRAVHIPNGGPGRAREAGRKLAQGEFIQYLDSDDELLPRKFELQTAALVSDLSAGIAYGQTIFGPEGVRTEELGPWKRTGKKIATLFPAMLVDRWWDTLTPLYRRAVVDAAGPWLDLRINEDWEYDCRIAAAGVRLAYVPVPLSRVYDHAGPCLHRGSDRDRGKLRDRAKAMELIFGHARRAGLGGELPEMRHFARAAFLLARQCGVAGEVQTSRACWQLATEAAEGLRGDLFFYRVLTLGLGWVNAARWITWTIARTGRSPGKDTLPSIYAPCGEAASPGGAKP